MSGRTYFVAAKSREFVNAWRRRSIVWRITEAPDGRQLRRTLLDVETGEILDDVWRDAGGRVRSYSRAIA